MTMLATVSLADLLSRQGRRDPYPFYAELHRAGPMCLLPARQDRFDLVVHGYDAVHRVMRDPTFRVMDAEYPDRRGLHWADHPALRTLTSSIFFTDGPAHRRTRRLFSQEFTPRRIAALEPAIVRIIDELLDRLAELGAGGATVDFLSEFALPLPSNVIGELLGVPEQDRAWFPPRVRDFGAILDLGTGTWRGLRAADAAAAELTAYFADLVAQRRARPRDDLVSALVHGAEAGQADDELLANLITMFNAGFVTTTHLIGNGLVLLLEHPEASAAMLADPDSTPGYVEEILRYEAPTQFSIRWAGEDTELMDVPVAADTRVLLLFGAANRDPARFDHPDRFDPSRVDNQHVSFGSGLHYCLGAALTRFEGQLALPMLLRRFPRLAIAGPLGDRDRLMLRGYDSIPVRIT
jgi:cytochrome P450